MIENAGGKSVILEPWQETGSAIGQIRIETALHLCTLGGFFPIL